MAKAVDNLEQELDEAVSAYGLASYREGKVIKTWGPGTDKYEKAVREASGALYRLEQAMSELVAAARVAHEVDS